MDKKRTQGTSEVNKLIGVYNKLVRDVYPLQQREFRNNPYHNASHIRDVVNSASKLAILEGMFRDSIPYWLVKIGALVHEIGFLKSPKDHEGTGRRIMKNMLPMMGCNETYTRVISNMIPPTKMPQKPRNPLQRILCDADVRNLGGEDFFEKGKLVRKELENSGIKMDDQKWYESSLKILNEHNYHTESARILGDEGKEKNRKELEKMLRGDGEKSRIIKGQGVLKYVKSQRAGLSGHLYGAYPKI